MKQIFFVHGDKGGVGKTEVAKRMAAVMLQAGRTVTLVDGDNKNPGLHAAFEHSGLDVQRINVMTAAGRDALFDVIAEAAGDVLIDLPARGSDVTERLNRDGASEDGFSLELLLREIVNGGVKLGHVAAQNWATLGLRGTRVMGSGQSAALSI